MIKAVLKGLFGGGSSYVYLFGAGLLTTIVLMFIVERSHMKSKIEDYKTEISTLETQGKQKDEIIISRAKTAERRQQADAQTSNSKEKVNGQPKTSNCVNSPSIIVGLDELRNNRKSSDSNDD